MSIDEYAKRVCDGLPTVMLDNSKTVLENAVNGWHLYKKSLLW